jgi:hypothetical protein
MRRGAGGAFWSIACHFNPAGFEARRRNFRDFRERLSGPLLAVELAFGDAFDLRPQDADILIRLRGQDVMWHKEALLMAGLRHLPADCAFVAWLDADVVFERADWKAVALEGLSVDPVLQLYACVHHMPPGWRPSDPMTEPEFSQEGLAALVAAGRSPKSLLEGVLSRDSQSAAVGFGWAARRDLLETHGLYRGLIVGGGDTAYAAAVCGCPEVAVQKHFMNSRQTACYMDWALPVSREVQSKVGFVPGAIRHLWHGTMENRRSIERHRLLAESGFDPSRDLRWDERGAMGWSSAPPGLEPTLGAYFRARRHELGA